MRKSRLIRGILVCFVLTALTMAFASPASAQMGTQAGSFTEGCAVTSVVLHGQQPATIACLKHTDTTLAVSPNTSRSGCNGYNLMVSDSHSHAWCFKGTGYLAYRINDIWGFTSNNYNGWFRIYPNGSTNGWFQTWNSPGQIYDYFPYDGQHSITQICIKRSSSTTC